MVYICVVVTVTSLRYGHTIDLEYSATHETIQALDIDTNSGVTERLGALGHNWALHHEPCHITVNLNARPTGLTAMLHSIIIFWIHKKGNLSQGAEDRGAEPKRLGVVGREIPAD